MVIDYGLVTALLMSRDRRKPLFLVTAVTGTAAETIFSVLVETETTPKL